MPTCQFTIQQLISQSIKFFLANQFFDMWTITIFFFINPRTLPIGSLEKDCFKIQFCILENQNQVCLRLVFEWTTRFNGLIMPSSERHFENHLQNCPTSEDIVWWRNGIEKPLTGHDKIFCSNRWASWSEWSSCLTACQTGMHKSFRIRRCEEIENQRLGFELMHSHLLPPNRNFY